MSIIMSLLGKKLVCESVRKLLNEEFGFDYVWPEDINQAIYDFYALSIIDPWHLDIGRMDTDPILVYGTKQATTADPKYHDYTDITDLRFSLMRAKVINTRKMREFMLEACRRAVVCELIHLPAFHYPTRETDFLTKLPNAYRPAYDKFKAYVDDDVPSSYDARYDKYIKEVNLTDWELFGLASPGFVMGGWSSSFGGKNWKAIADVGLDIYNSPIPPKEDDNFLQHSRTANDLHTTMEAIDHAIDLEHNTGSIFTKWPEVSKNIHVYKNPGSKNTLETKKHITNIKVYKDLVSPSLKDAIVYLSRYESLTKEDYKYKKKVKDEYTGEMKEKTFDLITHKEIYYDALTDEETAAAVNNLMTEMGIEKTHDSVSTITKKIETILDGINLKHKEPKEELKKATSQWAKYLTQSLDRLYDLFGVDKDSSYNKTLVISKIDEVIANAGIPKRKKVTHTHQGVPIHTAYDDLTKDLMTLPWKYSAKESMDAMLQRYRITGKARLIKNDYDYLEEWLKYQYKNNRGEFDAFVSGFVPAVEEATSNRLTSKQKEYIDDMIEKTRGKAYARTMKRQKQPALDL